MARQKTITFDDTRRTKREKTQKQKYQPNLRNAQLINGTFIFLALAIAISMATCGPNQNQNKTTTLTNVIYIEFNYKYELLIFGAVMAV